MKKGIRGKFNLMARRDFESAFTAICEITWFIAGFVVVGDLCDL